MDAPTIVRQTKDYLLVKIPLPSRENFRPPKQSTNGKMTAAEKRLWMAIQEGEREHRLGKTIEASSIDEALEIYERRKKHKRY